MEVVRWMELKWERPYFKSYLAIHLSLIFGSAEITRFVYYQLVYLPTNEIYSYLLSIILHEIRVPKYHSAAKDILT